MVKNTGTRPQANIRLYWAHFNLKLHTFSVVYMENARQDRNGKEYMEDDQPLEGIYL